MSGPVAMTDERLSFVSFEDAENPPGGTLDHMVDRWWIVHPIKGLLIWRGFSRQCNHDRRITESLRDKLYPWAEVRFIPSAFVPADRAVSGGKGEGDVSTND